MAEQVVGNANADAKQKGWEVSYNGVKAQLMIESGKVDEAVKFYKGAFKGIEVSREVSLKRKVGTDLPLVTSAELIIAHTSFLLVDLPNKVMSVGAGMTFVLGTNDVKAAVDKAVAAGAKVDGEIAESEEGLVVGKLKDPYGYDWVISSPAKTAEAEVSAET